jgi:hypothetical protein
MINENYHHLYYTFKKFVEERKNSINEKLKKSDSFKNDLNSLFHVKNESYSPLGILKIFKSELKKFLNSNDLKKDFDNFLKKKNEELDSMKKENQTNELKKITNEVRNIKNNQKKIFLLYGDRKMESTVIFEESIKHFAVKLEEKGIKNSDFQDLMLVIDRKIEPYKSNFGLFPEINCYEAFIIKSGLSDIFEKFYLRVFDEMKKIDEKDFHYEAVKEIIKEVKKDEIPEIDKIQTKPHGPMK